MPVTLDIKKDYRYNQGLDTGKVEGRIEGKVEGRIEGKLEGRIEGKLEMAKEMLAKGYSVDLIREISKLSEQEILEIASSLKKED